MSQIYGALFQRLLLSHPASSTLMGAGSPTSSSPTHQGSHMWASTEAAVLLWCEIQTTICRLLACSLQAGNQSSDYTSHALKCSSLQNLQDTSHIAHGAGALGTLHGREVTMTYHPTLLPKGTGLGICFVPKATKQY